MSTGKPTYKIRKFKKTDTESVAELICKTFTDQNAKENSKQAQELFLQYNTPNKILELSNTTDIFVAEIQNRIVGVIVGIDNNRVIRLFVNKKFQGIGIAKTLLQKIETMYKKRGAKKMHIRASLYAQNFYAAMGYKKATRRLTKFGVIHQPMIKKLKKGELI
jgi:predicted GNAT family N-acyltransferase